MADITLINRKYRKDSSASSNFGRRFGAAFIDLFFLSILIFLLKIALPDFSNLWFFTKSSPFLTENSTNWALSQSSLIGIWIIYSFIMDCTSLQGTVGKQVMGIIVTDNAGNRITLLQSLNRNLFKIVSYAIFGLGFLNVLADSKKRGWHDIVANTLVVQK